MSDGVSPAVITATQEKLGKYVKKPPLTSKLLSRPPFKYLHDIFTSVIKEHRFMEGLFTDAEAVADNLRERDAKIALLDKVIRMVALANGKELPVRATSIIAGKEVEQTNLLLQELAVAIEKKDQNADLVKRVLKGEGPAQAKKTTKARDASGDAKDEKKKEKGDERDRSRDKRRDDKDEKRRDDKDEKRKDDRDDKKGSREEKKDDKKKDEKDERKRDDRDGKRRDEKRGDSRGRDASREKSKQEEQQQDKKSDAKRKEQQQQQQPPKKQQEEDDDDEGDSRLQRPSSAKGNRRLRDGRKQQSSDEEQRRQTEDREGSAGARAPSARPAPRVKAAGAAGIVEDSGSKKVSGVIIEHDQDSDDDQFVVEEAPTTLLAGGGGGGGLDDEEDDEAKEEDEEQHGGLVKEMLKSKKEFNESTAGQEAAPKTMPTTTDTNRRQAKVATEKEITKLKQEMQTLTRSANPLGKVIDFIQEDLESMRKELERWQAETKAVTAELLREQSSADASLNGLRHQLQELEQAEKDKLDLIATVKANIVRNDERISKMVEAMSRA